jgi:eukaryotic-like serine/threonine-protein kinase
MAQDRDANDATEAGPVDPGESPPTTPEPAPPSETPETESRRPPVASVTDPLTGPPETVPVAPSSRVAPEEATFPATGEPTAPTATRPTERRAPVLGDAGVEAATDSLLDAEGPKPTDADTPGSADPDDFKTALGTTLVEPGITLFGRYRVERQLGEGGMGSVWLVRHLELDTLRALKLIVSGIAFDPRARARFKREARLMARLSHPNAVAVHDARMSADAAFIEMEYISGGSLSQRLRPGEPMPLDEVARLLDQLCDVVQDAHDLGIVHRDLKPSNLMLLEGRSPGRDVLKVVDFGIAKIFDPDQRTQEDNVTRSGGAAFTPQYASPEQIGGSEVDGRSDLYSIGVILYELLTGYRPFSGTNLLYNQFFAAPPPFVEKNPAANVPAEVERVVMWCLAKDAAARPQSARELAEVFHQALASSGSPGAGGMAAPEFVFNRGPQPATVPDTPRELASLDTIRLDGSLPRTEAAGSSRPVVSSVSAPRRPVSRRWFLLGAPLIALLAAPLLLFGRRLFTTTAARPGLPEGYAPEPGAKTVDGWPGAIVRTRDKTRFIRLQGGSFLMGDDSLESSPGSKARRDERPAHPVELSGFYIQETEVTNGEMDAYFHAPGIEQSARPKRWLDAVAEASARTGKPARYPAVGIPHSTAEDYARWVGGALPTEAQWEYAARSGGQDRRQVWGNAPWKPGKAILAQHGEGEGPSIVGESSDRTAQGVADMAGNVREWCRDVYAPYRSSPEPVRDPTGPPDEGRTAGPVPHVLRGGSYRTWPDAGRTTGPRRPSEDDGSYTLVQITEDGTADDLGFRVVIEWPPRPAR